MVPEKDSPCWRKFVISGESYEFRHLVTQLMYSQIKLLLQRDQSEPAVNAAAELVYDFFVKNHKVVMDDLKTAIGKWEDGHE